MSVLSRIQLEQAEWAQRNFPDSMGPEKLYVPALGVAEEAGELCHEVLKLDQGIRGTYTEHLDNTIDAVGDITIYLLDLCNKLNIDFESCVINTWQIVKQRDWVKYPKDGRTE